MPLEVARARAAIEESRQRIAAGLSARAGEITFTSGGTESNNWALAGSARRFRRSARQGGHAVVSALEHKSVLRTAEHLGQEGFSIGVLPCGPEGAVRAADLERLLRSDTFLVSVMLANNETGVLQPAAEIGALCRSRGIAYHCDAVAAIGRVPVDVEALGCDLLSLSSHKLYAPKGTGVLFVRGTDGAAPLEPLIHGCGQQGGLRGGTENTAGAVALGAAFQRMGQGAFQAERIQALRDLLEHGLQERFPRAERNGSGARLANTLSVYFPGRSGVELQAALAARGFSVAAGAAASGGAASHVLLAMGCSEERARSTLRFSLGAGTTRAGVEDLLAALEAVLAESAPRKVRA